MTNAEMIKVLKDEADRNPASRAVLFMFSQRQRPRGTLTLDGLVHRMRQDGFPCTKKDFEPIIKALASVGIGVLNTTGRGKLIGLKEITTDFKSVGECVFGEAVEIKTFTPRVRFTKVTPPPRRSSLLVRPGLHTPNSNFQVSLDVLLNGKHVLIPVPKDLTNEDLAALIGRFKTGS